MSELTSEERGTLRIVAAYQERHHGLRVWAGREGTTEAELEGLVAEGLLDRVRDENGYRWWYGITKAGERAIA